MMDKVELARRGLRAAIELRTKHGIAEDAPISVFDLAESAGLDVRFCLGDSFEGMYSKATATVLVPTMRPRGRQAFACAHEVGHWYFGHGSRLEHLTIGLGAGKDPEEFLADVFAGYLLMPPWAIRRALRRRGLLADALSPKQLYLLASQLGVGYLTLADHLCYSLKLISASRRASLISVELKNIRKDLLGALAEGCRHAPFVDGLWESVPIDLGIGDLAIIPSQCVIEGQNIQIAGTTKDGVIIRACQTGLGRCHKIDNSWSAFVRVSRSEFFGRSSYRHLEDPDVN